MASSARALMLALQYFTRVPLPGALARWTGYNAELQRASLAHFPAIGWLVGSIAVAVYWLADHFLPVSVATPWVAATAMLTGALHEDGLADTADGLGGSANRERALEIMKDPRLGSHGTLALVLSLLAKTGLLAIIGSVAGHQGAAVALFGGHVVSRGLTLVIVATLPNVGLAAQSKTMQVASGMAATGQIIAAAWTLAGVAWVVLWASPGFAASALAAAVLALAWMRRLLARRLQGFTGDGLGATQQLCELAFYLGACLFLGNA